MEWKIGRPRSAPRSQKIYFQTWICACCRGAAISSSGTPPMRSPSWPVAFSPKKRGQRNFPETKAIRSCYRKIPLTPFSEACAERDAHHVIAREVDVRIARHAHEVRAEVMGERCAGAVHPLAVLRPSGLVEHVERPAPLLVRLQPRHEMGHALAGTEAI